ncbi:MAG: hypothetical protein U5N58_14570 [Actinomycetota bacterium]|nr:hypothetical protein [Actinomycetota bacterium]
MEISYRGKDISLDGEWKKISMIEAISEIGNIEVSFDMDRDHLAKIAQKRGKGTSFFGEGQNYKPDI